MSRNWDRSSVNSIIINLSASLAMVCFSSQALAAAFQLVEQNVTNLGLAFSGTAALAEDASTAYYNPAGLTRLGESEIVLAGFVISGSLDLSPITVTPSFGPGPVLAGDDNDAGTTSPVGALYVAKRLDERWVLGFSITTPFGLFTQYEDDSAARYLATKSQLETFDFSPSIGFRVNRCLSLGVGADALYTKAKLHTRLGFGDPATDGLLNNDAEGWGYGWHAGILWEPFSRTRLGFNYRSDFSVHAEGNADFQTPQGVVPFTTSIQTVTANVTLPSTATLSFYQGITRYFAVTADVAWTDWSRFRTLRLRYNPNANGSSFDTDTFEHFEDSYRYAIGLIYNPCDRLTFRIGGAFDETPVQDEFRTARIPDGDRTWFALGAGYVLTNCLRLDIGYAYISFADVSVNEHAPFRAFTEVPANSATLTGDYKGSAHIGGIQIRYDFV